MSDSSDFPGTHITTYTRIHIYNMPHVVHKCVSDRIELVYNIKRLELRYIYMQYSVYSFINSKELCVCLFVCVCVCMCVLRRVLCFALSGCLGYRTFSAN